MTIRPNVFIVGAMKCGTTVLSDNLALHPAVRVARGKEIHYFTLNIDKGEEWYLSHFDSDEDTLCAVDASPTYLDTCNTSLIPKLIKSFNPDAKIIILIRDPVDRAISHFNHLVKIDKVACLADTTFEKLMSQDLLTGMLGGDQQAFYLDLIVNFSAYSKKIAHFANVFGKDRVLVLHNDDLRAHGALVMRRVFEFLDLPPIESEEFSKQKYLGGTSRKQISVEREIDLYRLYSQDYIAACATRSVQRFSDPSVASMDKPAGAVVGDVALGHDGWLFLAHGANAVVDFFTGKAPTAALVAGWIDRVRARRQRLGAMGVAYLHMFIPEKLSVYHHKIPWSIDPALSPGRMFAKAAPRDIQESVVNIFGLFEGAKDRRALFYKTDSHWNHAGAFLAYQMICHRLGVEADNELLKRRSVSGELALDLGAKLSPPVKEKARFVHFVRDAQLVDEGELVRYKKETGRVNDAGLHVGSMVRYVNPKASSPLRVMLFGDSFSEYRDHLLSGLLAETFAEFMFVWSTSVDYKLVGEFRPDVVIGALTERFMTRVPDDSIDVRRYVADLLAREDSPAPA